MAAHCTTMELVRMCMCMCVREYKNCQHKITIHFGVGRILNTNEFELSFVKYFFLLKCPILNPRFECSKCRCASCKRLLQTEYPNSKTECSMHRAKIWKRDLQRTKDITKIKGEEEEKTK